jgi:hypothetical protein
MTYIEMIASARHVAESWRERPQAAHAGWRAQVARDYGATESDGYTAFWSTGADQGTRWARPYDPTETRLYLERGYQITIHSPSGGWKELRPNHYPEATASRVP